MKTSTLSHTARETTSTKEQEKLHQHKEEQACLKETMRKMGDLFEEVRMDVETEDQCIQEEKLPFWADRKMIGVNE